MVNSTVVNFIEFRLYSKCVGFLFMKSYIHGV